MPGWSTAYRTVSNVQCHNLVCVRSFLAHLPSLPPQTRQGTGRVIDICPPAHPCPLLLTAWMPARTAAAAGGTTRSGRRASRGVGWSSSARGASAAPVQIASTCHRFGRLCPRGTTRRTAARATAAHAALRSACGPSSCRARAERCLGCRASWAVGCSSRTTAGARRRAASGPSRAGSCSTWLRARPPASSHCLRAPAGPASRRTSSGPGTRCRPCS